MSFGVALNAALTGVRSVTLKPDGGEYSQASVEDGYIELRESEPLAGSDAAVMVAIPYDSIKYVRRQGKRATVVLR